MEIKLKFSDVTIDQAKLKEKAQYALQVSAMRAREEMVERLPARGQTPYATGRLRESIRFEHSGDLEYTFYVPVPYGVFVEFGTGPKGRVSGAVPEFPNDPQPGLSYHFGEVLVTRYRGRFLDIPILRYTQGMYAQPYVRPALVLAVDILEKLLAKLL